MEAFLYCGNSKFGIPWCISMFFKSETRCLGDATFDKLGNLSNMESFELEFIDFIGEPISTFMLFGFSSDSISTSFKFLAVWLLFSRSYNILSFSLSTAFYAFTFFNSVVILGKLLLFISYIEFFAYNFNKLPFWIERCPNYLGALYPKAARFSFLSLFSCKRH